MPLAELAVLVVKTLGQRFVADAVAEQRTPCLVIVGLDNGICPKTSASFCASVKSATSEATCTKSGDSVPSTPLRSSPGEDRRGTIEGNPNPRPRCWEVFSVLHCNGEVSSVLHCHAAVCSVLHCIEAVCTALHCNEAVCSVLDCKAAVCSVLECNAAVCTLLDCNAAVCRVRDCNAAACIVLHCNVVFCSFLHCNVVVSSVSHCILVVCSVLHCNLVACSVLHCNVVACSCAIFRLPIKAELLDRPMPNSLAM